MKYIVKIYSRYPIWNYDNYFIVGDFNFEPHYKGLRYFSSNNLVNLVKTNTCFKSSGSCIDLILKNRKYLFKNTNSYETGLSDYHHMILTMLKTTCQIKEPKCLIYVWKLQKWSLGSLTEMRGLIWCMWQLLHLQP